MKFEAVSKLMRNDSHVHPKKRKLQSVLEMHPQSESVIEEFVDRELRHHDETHRKGGRNPSHGPLPIIIGITGHRDLREEDIPATEATLREQYKRLQTLYPSTSFILISALADGADRLGARLALEIGLRLIVVLPMPRRIYVTDFDEASVRDFNQMIDRAEHWFELPILPGVTEEDIAEHGPPRAQQYALVGAYLAMHSTILVALWDGVPKQLVGGTSQVVRYKLDGVPEPFAPPHSELDAPDNGPVYHIVTPRVSNPTPIGEPFSLHRIYPSGYQNHTEADKAYEDMYERMDTFNRDTLLYAEELQEGRRTSKEYLFPSKSHKTMPAMLRETLDFYSIADVLSQRFQKRTMMTLRTLLTFIFFAAVFYELYTGFFDGERVMIALYLTMFVFSAVSYNWAKRKGYQTKYLDYRALAEGLRVQFFWRLAGLKDSVADYYMRKQKSELDWIRHAVRSCMTETCADDHDPDFPKASEHERLRQVLKHWVEDQARYFAKAAHRDHETMHKTELKVTLIFGVALALAALQLLLQHPSNYILIGVGVLPVLAAVLHSYVEKNALSEHTKQYDRMSVFYHRAKVHLEKLIDEGRTRDAQHFIAELGREALAENGDWILTHRERPLEVPKGG